VLFTAIAPLQAWLLKRSALARQLAQRQDPYAELPMSTERKYLTGQVVLVGYGQVGRGIAQQLVAGGIPCVVTDHNRELVESLRNAGLAAVWGNAAEPEVLIQAHIAHAAMLVIAVADTLHVRQMAETARALNPGIEIVVRSHSEEESALLRADGIGTVVVRDEALAQCMARHVLQRVAPSPATAPGALQTGVQHG
jgi:CPA2 family monovalent cation:H+ antiporter-2